LLVKITGFRSNFTGEPRIVWKQFSFDVLNDPITFYPDLRAEFDCAKKWADAILEMASIKRLAGAIRDDQISNVIKVDRCKFQAHWHYHKEPFDMNKYDTRGEAYFSKLLIDSYMCQNQRKAFPLKPTEGKDLRVNNIEGDPVKFGKFSSDEQYLQAKLIARKSAPDFGCTRPQRRAWIRHVKEKIEDIYGST
jgi:hypothetical protein